MIGETAARRLASVRHDSQRRARPTRRSSVTTTREVQSLGKLISTFALPMAMLSILWQSGHRLWSQQCDENSKMRHMQIAICISTNSIIMHLLAYKTPAVETNKVKYKAANSSASTRCHDCVWDEKLQATTLHVNTLPERIK